MKGDRAKSRESTQAYLGIRKFYLYTLTVLTHIYHKRSMSILKNLKTKTYVNDQLKNTHWSACELNPAHTESARRTLVHQLIGNWVDYCAGNVCTYRANLGNNGIAGG
jgi:hypothetical protein